MKMKVKKKTSLKNCFRTPMQCLLKITVILFSFFCFFKNLWIEDSEVIDEDKYLEQARE